MKPNTPVGFAALLELMPKRFRAQAHAVKKHAARRREAQAKRFELEFLCGVEVKDSAWEDWQDTIAEFNSRGDDHRAP